MEIKIRLSPGAIMPTQVPGTTMSFDLTAKEVKMIKTPTGIEIHYDTGVRIRFPDNYVAVLHPRVSGGLRAQESIFLCRSNKPIAGVLFWEHRENVGEADVQPGDRVATLTLIRIPIRRAELDSLEQEED